MEELEKIKELMKRLLLSDKRGAWRPIKGTTKQQCYDVLGEIQTILKTNVMEYYEENTNT